MKKNKTFVEAQDELREAYLEFRSAYFDAIRPIAEPVVVVLEKFLGALVRLGKHFRL